MRTIYLLLITLFCYLTANSQTQVFILNKPKTVNLEKLW